MKLLMRPLDTLFFRDGKPFSLGENSWADGIFPPFPSVLYGALRTWYISNHTSAFSAEAIEESAGIKILGIQYRLPKGRHLPMPLDCVTPKDKNVVEQNREEKEKTYQAVALEFKEQSGSLSNHPLPGLLLPPEGLEVESLDDGLISNEGDLESYLQGTLTELKVKRLKDYAPSEPKVGIGRDNATNTATDSMLYRVGMRRASSFELLVEAELPGEHGAPASMMVKLGGEGKVVALEPSQERIRISEDAVVLRPGGFKLYFSTPAIFNKGWKPDLPFEAELLAAVVGKPLHIGGFDMAARNGRGYPKPMYKAVPAGSVYYYRTNESPETIMQRLHGKALSDMMPEQGFGIAYVGNI